MSFSCRKDNLTGFFNRLDRPVEEYRPDLQPDRPVDPTGAGRPDRFPSQTMTETISKNIFFKDQLF